MAEEFIEHIYKKATIISELKICRKYLRIRNIDEFSILWTNNAELLIDIANEARVLQWEKADTLNKSIIAIKEGINDVYRVLGILDEILIPTITDFMKTFYTGIDVEVEKWRLSSSKSGFLSLYSVEDSVYVHDVIDPLFDAYEIAENMYTGRKEHIIIFGAGLGYLPYEIWKYSNKSAVIHVVEKDQNIVDFAYKYGVLSWIDEEYLDIKVGPEWFDKNLELDTYGEKGLCIISDYVKKYFPERVRTHIYSYIEFQRGHSIFERYYSVNYWRNCDNFDGIFSDYKKEYEDVNNKDEFIVVASGPSVDDRMEYIRSNVGKKTIIAVNSVLNKLLKEGIKPDLVCLLDPTKEVYPYLPDTESAKDIPLIAESIAYWKYVKDYPGKKYKFFSTNYEASVNELERIGEKKVVVGATVTSLALAIAIELKAKRIEVIGVDLGFPLNKTYAKNVGENDSLCVNNILNDLYRVASVDGGVVKTVNAFNVFRSDIEKQLLLHPEIEYFNLSLHGAYIQGMISGEWLNDKINNEKTSYELREKENVIYSALDNQLVAKLRRLESALVNPEIDWKNDKSILNYMSLDNTSNIEKDSIKTLILIWRDRAERIHNSKAQIYIDSILARLFGDKDAVVRVINAVMSDNCYSELEYSFVFWQIRSLIVEEIISIDETLKIRLADMARKYIKGFLAKISDEKRTVISNGNRDSELIFYIVDSFCDTEGETEQLILDDCFNIMQNLHKKVLLVNTAEECHMVGSIPFYQYQVKEYNPEYSKLESIDYKGISIPFFQCDYVMPDAETIDVLLEMIHHYRPMTILYKGEGGVLGNIAQYIVPNE